MGDGATQFRTRQIIGNHLTSSTSTMTPALYPDYVFRQMAGALLCERTRTPKRIDVLRTPRFCQPTLSRG
eukprot:6667953-Lingulodinium_polyedra.AAC.1